MTLGVWRFVYIMKSLFVGLWGVTDDKVGKSPLIGVLAMLISFLHIENDSLDQEPGFRLRNQFVHLRHEAGTKEYSEVFDEGRLGRKRPWR